MRTHRIGSWGLAAAAVAAMAITGCSQGKTKPEVATVGGARAAAAASGGTDDADRLRQYAKCMRDQGIDVPDSFATDPNFRYPTTGEQADKIWTAWPACKTLLPAKMGADAVDANTMKQLLTYSRCMREHGIPLPDPGPDGRLPADARKGADVDSAAMDKAMELCLPK